MLSKGSFLKSSSSIRRSRGVGPALRESLEPGRDWETGLEKLNRLITNWNFECPHINITPVEQDSLHGSFEGSKLET